MGEIQKFSLVSRDIVWGFGKGMDTGLKPKCSPTSTTFWILEQTL